MTDFVDVTDLDFKGHENDTAWTALYVRCSTSSQDYIAQRDELVQISKKRGFSNLVVYAEKASATDMNRPIFQRLLEDAKKENIVRVCCSDLSRLTRTGTADTILTIREFQKYNVDLISYHDNIDFSGEIGLAIAGFLGALNKIDQRTRKDKQALGIAHAKKNGKTWGGAKKKVDTSLDNEIRTLRVEAKMSIRKIAITLKKSPTTIQSSCKRLGIFKTLVPVEI